MLNIIFNLFASFCVLLSVTSHAFGLDAVIRKERLLLQIVTASGRTVESDYPTRVMAPVIKDACLLEKLEKFYSKVKEIKPISDPEVKEVQFGAWIGKNKDPKSAYKLCENFDVIAYARVTTHSGEIGVSNGVMADDATAEEFIASALLDLSLRRQIKSEELSKKENNRSLQEAENRQPSSKTDIIKSLPMDVLRTLGSPTDWQSAEWTIAGLATVTSGLLMAGDKSILKAVQDQHQVTSNEFFENAERMGDGTYSFPAVGGIYLVGAILQSEDLQRSSLLAINSMISAGLLTNAIKLVSGRVRPNGTDSATDFTPVGGAESFPSGHTTLAFAMASAYATYYEDHPWVGYLAYTLAVMVPWQRMNDDKHWPSDVFVGAAIGIATGRSIVHRHQKKTDVDSAWLPALIPTEEKSYFGFQYVRGF